MPVKHDLSHPYQRLSPDCVLDAIESQGWRTDSRTLTLNSYENRVYQVGIDDDEPVIAKFYRPNRWNMQQIEEEHRFCDELAQVDLPVVCPQTAIASTDEKNANNTVFEHEGFFFSVSPRRRGQAPNIESSETLQRIGRFLGRLHAVGSAQTFQHRPELTVKEFGLASRSYLLQAACDESLRPANDGGVNMPDYLKNNYAQTTQLLLDIIEIKFEQTPYPKIRLHGDCHAGNWLQRDDALHLVDFDDTRMGPAVQDIWMLLSGDDHQQQEQLHHLLAGYRLFCDFDYRQVALIESLRTLRIMHYSAWLAKRWQDPAFPKHFPWFNTEQYWAEHVQTLREQLSRLQEPPLTVSSTYYL